MGATRLSWRGNELVRWLGVSRTPIREAIASLNAWGLVDLEANRFTKVATRDPEAFGEASRFLAGLHDLAAAWEGRNASPGLTKLVSAAARKIGNHEVDGTFELLDAYGELVTATGNTLFITTELPLRTRVKFLSPRNADEYDWDRVAARVTVLQGVIA